MKYGITKEFKEDIKEMFLGKSKSELEMMEKEINDTLNSNDVSFKMDFDYWEKIMKKLKVYKAKVNFNNNFRPPLSSIMTTSAVT